MFMNDNNMLPHSRQNLNVNSCKIHNEMEQLLKLSFKILINIQFLLYFEMKTAFHVF